MCYFKNQKPKNKVLFFRIIAIVKLGKFSSNFVLVTLSK